MSENHDIVVTGYTNQWSVAEGEAVTLHVSCAAPEYDVSIVRLRHGDLNSRGPGFRAESIPSIVDGVRPGRVQQLYAGSCVLGPESFTVPPAPVSVSAWIWPTTPKLDREQVILGWWHLADMSGFALILSQNGRLGIRTGSGISPTGTLLTGSYLQPRRWYFVAAVLDGSRATLHVRPRDTIAADSMRRSVVGDIGSVTSRASFIVGAAAHETQYGAHFNGKVDRPTVWEGGLTENEIETIVGGGAIARDAHLAWDFGHDHSAGRAFDHSSHSRHGRFHNCPMRAVTGWNWKGVVDCFAAAPEEYGAVWLHDDDLEDAGWDADVELSIPMDWPSGIYAFRLAVNADDPNDDYVPFIVRPRRGRPDALAFLVPTLTYLAYGNEHMWSRPARLARLQLSLQEFIDSGTPYEQAAFSYIIENGLHSIYDDHSDGSGVAYASRLRPILNFRPRYNKPALRFKYPHLLNCDLYIIDWLTDRGIDFVCITDDDLHREGYELLEPFRALMTGSHPEYWTERMLDGLGDWLDAGGRCINLGGNGFYWATSIDPERPWLLEQRRGETGSRAWTSEPGEVYHSTTGERGGLWRSRGRAPQVRLGVGFTAQCGDDRAQPYRRARASRDPRVAFIFEGVDDQLIGDFGLHMGGAAGWEIDRADFELGTPPHALVLASSFGHSDAYHHVIEEQLSSGADTGGSTNPLVRADLTYFEGLNGGAVFSTGSLTWAGSLSHNGYDNSVSRITENVTRRFLDATPIPPPPMGDSDRRSEQATGSGRNEEP